MNALHSFTKSRSVATLLCIPRRKPQDIKMLLRQHIANTVSSLSETTLENRNKTIRRLETLSIRIGGGVNRASFSMPKQNRKRNNRQTVHSADHRKNVFPFRCCIDTSSYKEIN